MHLRRKGEGLASLPLSVHPGSLMVIDANRGIRAGLRRGDRESEYSRHPTARNHAANSALPRRPCSRVAIPLVLVFRDARLHLPCYPTTRAYVARYSESRCPVNLQHSCRRAGRNVRPRVPRPERGNSRKGGHPRVPLSQPEAAGVTRHQEADQCRFRSADVPSARSWASRRGPKHDSPIASRAPNGDTPKPTAVSRPGSDHSLGGSMGFSSAFFDIFFFASAVSLRGGGGGT